MQGIDNSAMLFIQEHLREDFLTAVLRFFTHLGDAGLIWIALGIVLLLVERARQRGMVLLVSVGVTAALNNLVFKLLVARPRPYETLHALEPLIPPLNSYSFPSGHASASFAAATAMTMLFGKRGAWCFVPASIIAVSRSYLGVHYVSDILCGAALGTVTAAAVVAIARRRWGIKK